VRRAAGTEHQLVSPGVYSISILQGVRYDFRGQGYCSATKKESSTESIQVDGSDDSATEFTLTFRRAGCPRKPTNDSK
jgi:hypothetical protein